MSQERQKSQIILILLTVLAIFLLLTSSAAARSYSFDLIQSDITVDENGVTHVTHELLYTFETSPGDEYREVYYVILQAQNTTIHNITGRLSGYENSTFNYNRIADGYEITAQLPQPNPKHVSFIFSYDIYGGVNVYNDITEFNYMLRSNQWSEAADVFEANITITALDGNIFENESYLIYRHPTPVFMMVNTGSGNETGYRTINTTIREENVAAYSWMDVRILYPRMENPDSRYVTIINENGLEKIMAEEEAYQRKQIYPVAFIFIQLLVILAGIGGAVYIYWKHGREPKVAYNALYERNIPTNTKPAMVNAIITGHGKPSMDAFVSTIMSLVDRDYLSIRETDSTNWRGKDKKIVVLKFEKPADSGLEKFESDVYHFLRRYAVNDEIDWKDFQKKLGSNDSFYNFLNKWNADVEKQSRFDDYFDSKGNKLIGSLGIVLIIESILMYFISEMLAPSIYYPLTSTATLMCLFSGILGIALIVYPIVFKKSMGRWTDDGRVFYLKWKNFEKYLTDYSLIEQYPPASVIIWDHYIVYAMALGVADEALKNMNLAMPSGGIQGSRFAYVYYYPFFYTGMRSAYSSSTPQSSGGGGPGSGMGGGGIGGGFGGGFGGAR
ncbi:hypothetical protein MmiAt1_09360 [Methanimicrococcus sp. At1]|uniref:DUF2207 domain-containing protein n=1 Tax=Methanimicrococcus hacksteinii TaxID=3028293 RepID=A0ABU3VPQ8_9EURY|nr:DUF2207 domain-containing protein [Methanimicrococcus sp. At1]MDV0445361.1 hypothetical protein [Methanimicrococcus sp. At1]